jgi:hypothetical protein
MAPDTSPDREPTPESPAAPRRTRRVPVLVVALVGVAVVALGVGAAVLLDGSSDPAREPEVRTYVIPAGTADRLDRGEKVDAVPSEISLHVGDRLVVRNEDRRKVEVGPYVVRPGDTLEQDFYRPQNLIGECLVTPTGQVRILVEE